MNNSSKTTTKISSWIVPTLALVLICGIVTGALAFTYQATSPTIQKNQEAFEKTSAEEVLGGQEGIALKTETKSYGGKMEVMVGFKQDGEITGVKVLSHSDTPGLGTLAMEADYLKQYQGLRTLSADHIDEDDQVDAITGATISSNAIYKGIQGAIKKYDEERGSRK